ncbi:synaptonemal complex protein 1-like [Watersipora subatra]|uniref:synaptonemal complex protein 1-like n=1 Tax=Watersipora subatra TaxID=2589382 RepID=UPI00355C04ED
MASNSTELKQLLSRYCDDTKEKEKLREVLKKTSVEDRYVAMLSCKGSNGWTPAVKSAVGKDIETIKSEQQKQLLTLTSSDGKKVKDLMTLPDLTYGYFSEQALKSSKKSVQELDLKVKAQTAELDSSKKSVQELDLKVKAQTAELNSSKKSVQELDRKVKAQAAELNSSNKSVHELDKKVKAQAEELSSSKKTAQDLDMEVKAQAATFQRMVEMQRDMQRETQRSLREIDEFNRRCFSTGDTGDQDHEDQLES